MHTPLTILVYGHDPTLRETRRLILQHAGYNVFAVDRPSEAENYMQSETVDLIILCQSLTEREREAALASLTAMRLSIKILVMKPVADQMPAGPWETFDGIGGADKLIEAVRQVLAAG